MELEQMKTPETAAVETTVALEDEELAENSSMRVDQCTQLIGALSDRELLHVAQVMAELQQQRELLPSHG